MRLAALLLLLTGLLVQTSLGVEDELETQLKEARASAKRCLNLVKGFKDGAKQLEEKLKDCKQASINHKGEMDHDAVEKIAELTETNKKLDMEVKHSAEKLERLAELSKANEDLEARNKELVNLGKTLRRQASDFEKDAQDAMRSLEVEKELTERLERLCQSKGSDDAIQKVVVQNKQQNFIQQLEMKIQSLQEKLLLSENSNVDDKAELEAKVRSLSTSLASSKDQVVELKDDLVAANNKLDLATTKQESLVSRNDELAEDYETSKRELKQCQEELTEKTEALEKLNTEQVQFLEEKQELEERVTLLTEAEKRWKSENEALAKVYKEYKEKANNPALLDLISTRAAWLMNPQVDGLDRAYDKTVRVIGPKLNRTDVAIKQLTALLELSSTSLTNMVGKPEMSPVVSGMLTYGILLIPFALSLCILVRVKNAISLAKLTLWMTLYNALFCLAAYGMYFVANVEPMLALRLRNEESYEFLQLLMAAFYTLYAALLCLFTLKQIVFQNRCGFGVRELLQIMIPAAVCVHYYQTVWLNAMMDKPPVIEYDYWAYYAGGFILVFASLSFCKRKKKAPLPLPTKVEPVKTEQVQEDVGVPLKAVAKDKPPKKAHKKKKHKKSKHGHRVLQASEDPNTIEVEFLNPDKLVEKASVMVEAAQTGASLDEVKERRSREASRAKDKDLEDSDESEEDLESQKID